MRDAHAPHREYAFTEGGFTVEEELQLERAGFPYDLKAALQHKQPELVGKTAAIRDGEWTYVWRLYEPAELYNRKADPNERINVAGQPGCAEVESRLHSALLRWMVDTADMIPFEEDPRFPQVDLPVPTVVRDTESLELATWRVVSAHELREQAMHAQFSSSSTSGCSWRASEST